MSTSTEASDKGTVVLVVGAGQAGATAAGALRRFGFSGKIVLAGREEHAPYERPPLSKGVLSQSEAQVQIGIHKEDFYASNAIDLRLSCNVEELDVKGKTALLADGGRISFDFCLLATGGEARIHPLFPTGMPNVFYLRSLNDAIRLRKAMRMAEHVAVVGAGFLGMEAASTARELGLSVDVIDSAPAVLGRVMPPAFSSWLQKRADLKGVRFHMGRSIKSMEYQQGRYSLELDDGGALSASLIVVAIGLEPGLDLACNAGLDINPSTRGVRIDAQCRTSVPYIFAAGDCASQVQAAFDREVRLESWHSANEQARIAAATIAGVSTTPQAYPWFWTDQFDSNIQILGEYQADLSYVVRGESLTNSALKKALLIGLRGGRVRHVIAINAGGDLRPLREAIEKGVVLDPAVLEDTSQSLKQIVQSSSIQTSEV